MRSGDSPRVTPLRGFSPNAFQGFEGCDLECPLGEMKIIGPRAIAGHRRQTRTERLHSAGQRGWRRRLPFGNTKRGDVGRPSFGLDRLRNAKGRRPVLEHPRERGLHSRHGLADTGFGWHRNHDPLANPGSTQTATESATCPRSSKRPRDLELSMGLDDTHRRSRPRSRHPPRGMGRVEHRNERGPTSRFVVCRVLPGDIALRPCCDGRELGEASDCVPSDEGVLGPETETRYRCASCCESRGYQSDPRGV